MMMVGANKKREMMVSTNIQHDGTMLFSEQFLQQFAFHCFFMGKLTIWYRSQVMISLCSFLNSFCSVYFFIQVPFHTLSLHTAMYLFRAHYSCVLYLFLVNVPFPCPRVRRPHE